MYSTKWCLCVQNKLELAKVHAYKKCYLQYKKLKTRMPLRGKKMKDRIEGKEEIGSKGKELKGRKRKRGTVMYNYSINYSLQ